MLIQKQIDKQTPKKNRFRYLLPLVATQCIITGSIEYAFHRNVQDNTIGNPSPAIPRSIETEGAVSQSSIPQQTACDCPQVENHCVENRDSAAMGLDEASPRNRADSVHALLEMAHSSDIEVQIAALGALGSLLLDDYDHGRVDETVLQTLTDRLENDPSVGVRLVAANELSPLSGMARSYPDVLSALNVNTQNESADLRRTSIRVLGRLHQEVSIPILIDSFLNDDDENVRCEAAYAFAQYRDNQALITLLRDETQNGNGVPTCYFYALAMADRTFAVQGEREHCESVLGRQN